MRVMEKFKQFISKIMVVMVAVLLSSCAKPLTKGEVETIHRVGIINHFPEYFTHMTVDITMLGDHGFRRVGDLTLKEFVGVELKERFSLF
jgi:hypothetical protein